jgi:competence protein ComFC
MPVIEDCLIRHTHTPSQARTSSVTDRRENVADAFACRDQRLKGKQVLLIDDVSTSGATLNACTGVLKSAGALTVWGLVLALEL